MTDFHPTVSTVPANDYFGLIEGPFERKQHQNQQRGLDIYVRVINLDTGEICIKKLYRNGKGLHFKHTGYPSSYLEEMKQRVSFSLFQYIFATHPTAE